MAAFGVVLRHVTVAKTGKIFLTDNSIASIRGPGVCCAMVGDWISSCHKLKRALKTAGEMAGSTTHIVAQSSGEMAKTDQNIMKSYNLKPPAATALDEPVNFATLATLLSTQAGYCWIQIFGATGGHSPGASVRDGVFEYFDPNDGLYRFDDVAHFTTHVETDLNARYGAATNTDFTGSGNLYVFGALY
jgi:hypothetical protein